MAGYFSHDANARNSDKLLKVRMKHGAEGYGVFYMILERLFEEENYMSVKDYNMIAFDLRVDAGIIKSIIEDFGLFTLTDDGQCFYSESFNRRMAYKDGRSNKLSEAARKAANARWNKEKKSDDDATVMQTQCDGNADAMQNDANKIKEKKIKQNKNKLNKNAAAANARTNAFEFYQANFGILNSHINEDLRYWIQDLGDDLVIEALSRALEQGAQYSYAKSIMRDWASKGIQTLEQAKAEQLQYQRKRKSAGNKGKVEILPDWVNDPTTGQIKDSGITFDPEKLFGGGTS